MNMRFNSLQFIDLSPRGSGGGGGGGRGGGRGQGQGQGRGGGRGQGQGQGGGGRHSGAAMGECVCPKCGTTAPHERGMPCISQKCPKCGELMTRP